jgi:hypothetical protein
MPAFMLYESINRESKNDIFLLVSLPEKFAEKLIL